MNGIYKLASIYRAVIFMIIMVLIFISSAFAGSNMRRVKFIDFRGLKYLNKYEIIENVELHAEKEGIFIDMDALKRSLKNMPFIKKYSLSSEQNGLVISIVEEKPVYVLAYKKGNIIIPFELNKTFKIISAGKVHSSHSPLLIIGEQDVQKGRISERVKNVLLMINELKNTSLIVMKEIEEINISGDNAMISVRNRPAVFYLDLRPENLYLLNYLIGDLDKKGKYPRKIEFHNSFVVMK